MEYKSSKESGQNPVVNSDRPAVGESSSGLDLKSGQVRSAMNRRSFFQFAGAMGVALPAAAAVGHDKKRRAPFKILYSNDTTNVTTCVSPYHKRGEPMTVEMVQDTIDEVPGVEVHMLQPGLGWIPTWKSRAYPTAEHYRWVKETSGADPEELGKFVLAGNDLIQIFIDRCRLRGQTPFISYRLNDGHFQETVGTKSPNTVYVTRFNAEHLDYRIGTDNTWDQRVQNWAIPEVREHKFAFLTEICENYDIDGLELDFLRHCSFFRLGACRR